MNRLPQFEQNWSSGFNSCPQLLQYLSGRSTMPSNPSFFYVRRRVDKDPRASRNAWYRAYPLKEEQRNCQPQSARPGVFVPWTTTDRYYEEVRGSREYPKQADLSQGRP